MAAKAALKGLAMLAYAISNMLDKRHNAAAHGRFSRLLKNPTPCFDKLSMSGSPPRFHCTFPLTLSLSKGAQILFPQPVRP